MALSLRLKVEELLRRWEHDRSLDVALYDDPTVPECLRVAAERSAAIAALYIDELDRVLDAYARGQ